MFVILTKIKLNDFLFYTEKLLTADLTLNKKNTKKVVPTIVIVIFKTSND